MTASPPTVLSALTASVLEAARELGCDADAVCREAGLSAELLADPDARIPLLHHLRMWEALSRKPLGLQLGARLGIAGLGVIGYALRHDRSVGDALAFLNRHRALVHPDAVPRIAHAGSGDDARFSFVQVVPPPFARLIEPIDAQGAAIVALVRKLAGPDVVPTRVCLSRPEPTDVRAHRDFYRAPITWNAPAIEVEFHAHLLGRALPSSDPGLFGYLSKRTAELGASLPAQASFAARVREQLVHNLTQGEPSLDETAKALAVSARTLHRRLAGEHTGFQELVDDARRERALLLLADPKLSASEIAFLLGYNDPSTFFRAFKRWTGDTPQAHRRRAG